MSDGYRMVSRYIDPRYFDIDTVNRFLDSLGSFYRDNMHRDVKYASQVLNGYIKVRDKYRRLCHDDRTKSILESIIYDIEFRVGSETDAKEFINEIGLLSNMWDCYINEFSRLNNAGGFNV